MRDEAGRAVIKTNFTVAFGCVVRQCEIVGRSYMSDHNGIAIREVACKDGGLRGQACRSYKGLRVDRVFMAKAMKAGGG